MTKKQRSKARRSDIASDKARQGGALGVLLTLFRRRLGMAQKELAQKVGQSAAYLAMLESGSRSRAPLSLFERIAAALDLTDFERQELLKAAGHAKSPSDDPAVDTFGLDDVSKGTPLFLRPLEREAEFQREVQAKEIWIVNARPFDFNVDPHDRASFYESVKENIERQGTRYVYFQEDANGFERFKSALARDLTDPTKLETHVECILAPPATLFFSYAIYNPLKGKAFGRLTIFNNGIPLGLLPMDERQIYRIVDLLDGVRRALQSSDTGTMTNEQGQFRLLHPRRRPV